MAINPILAKDAFSQELFPLPLPSEVFVLKRAGVNFKVETPTGAMKGSGLFFLTNRRLVFLKDGKPEQHKDFTSFEIPLHLISDPKFEQPIFGANYMKGKVEPLTTAQNPLEGLSTWYLTFNKGGCGTFLNIFFNLYKTAKRNYTFSTSDLTHQLSQGANAAFVDPNDPSVVYVCQPTPDKPTSEIDFGGGYPVLSPPPLASAAFSNFGGSPINPPGCLRPSHSFEHQNPNFMQNVNNNNSQNYAAHQNYGSSYGGVGYNNNNSQFSYNRYN